MIKHLHTVHTLTATPLGHLLLAATPQGLSGAWFIEGQRGLPDWSSWGAPTHGHPLLGQAAREAAFKPLRGPGQGCAGKLVGQLRQEVL